MSHPPRRIVHIINSLTFGGAEAALCDLVLTHDRQDWSPHVLTLIDDMSVAQPLVNAGIPITTIGLHPGLPRPVMLMRLLRTIRRLGPDVVQCWMDHSNLLGGVAAWLGTGAPVIWGLHQSRHLPGYAKRTTLMTVAACARISRRVPSKIISCSHSGREWYMRSGFDGGKIRVIANGFDTERFKPDPDARQRVRAVLGADEESLLVCLPARLDPQKDHTTFLAAARILAARLPQALFVLCGKGVDRENTVLVRMTHEAQVHERCRLIGPQLNMSPVYSAMDLVVSSSRTEAFPLILGEAMSCGVVCAATDVGDSAFILQDLGKTVPPGDPEALAHACLDLLHRSRAERHAIGRLARRRICSRFSIRNMTSEYEQLYHAELAARLPQQACMTSALM